MPAGSLTSLEVNLAAPLSSGVERARSCESIILLRVSAMRLNYHCFTLVFEKYWNTTDLVEEIENRVI